MEAIDHSTTLDAQSNQEARTLPDHAQLGWLELDRMLQFLDDQPKIREPDNFRQNTFDMLVGLSSGPGMDTSPAELARIREHCRSVVEYLADLQFENASGSGRIHRSELHPAAQPILKEFLELGALLGCALVHTAQLPASRGYEPLLMENGCNWIAARGLAHLTVRMGKRTADENNGHGRVAAAIRFLAKPGRRRRQAILRRARLIVEACRETSIVSTIFDSAGMNSNEFVGLLISIIEGSEVNRERLTEIAITLMPSLSVPRGPKVTAASATHEVLLESLVQLDKPAAYTWNDTEGKFTDPATAATRLEFKDPKFDPRAAHRRLKARRGPIRT